MFSGWDRPSHWVIIAIVALVLFGYKKLPEASRSVGRSLRIFKTEMKGMGEDDKARDAALADPAKAEAEPTVEEEAAEVASEPTPRTEKDA